jgi:hypothetical protein
VKKRRGLGCLLLWWGGLAVLAVLIFTFDGWYWPLIGRVNNEAYFDGKPTSYWRYRLRDRDEPGQEAREALVKGWPDSEQVLLALLLDEEPLHEGSRLSAVKILRDIGPPARKMLPLLQKLHRRSTRDDLIHYYEMVIRDIAREEEHPP